MSLTTEASKLSTLWSPVILNLLEKYSTIGSTYSDEVEKYRDILPVYPPQQNIFRCFNYFDPQQTKVVILGQDPYHGPNQAIGLSFGVEDTIKQPPSLKNIMKKLKEEYSTFQTSSTLEHWAKQGILMLNAALTVRQKSPTSHMKLWLEFTGEVIKYLNDTCENVVFVAWGAFAHQLLEKYVNLDRHHLVTSSHPSPLGAYRKYKSHPSFNESKPFSRINELLEVPINW